MCVYRVTSPEIHVITPLSSVIFLTQITSTLIKRVKRNRKWAKQGLSKKHTARLWMIIYKGIDMKNVYWMLTSVPS